MIFTANFLRLVRLSLSVASVALSGMVNSSLDILVIWFNLESISLTSSVPSHRKSLLFIKGKSSSYEPRPEPSGFLAIFEFAPPPINDGTLSTMISFSWLYSPPLNARIANFFLLSMILGGFKVRVPEPTPHVTVWARVASAPPASDSTKEDVFSAPPSKGVVVIVGIE